MKNRLILASESVSRLELLKKISIYPDKIHAAMLDESPMKLEKPKDLALRLALAKSRAVAPHYENAYILAADTVSAMGRRILTKAESDNDVRNCITLLSGGRHKVYTAVNLIKVENGHIKSSNHKITTSIIKFKRLTSEEIEEYVLSGEGLGKSGGCCIEGMAEGFTCWISGSYSNIRGLPLYETKCLLIGMGYKWR